MSEEIDQHVLRKYEVDTNIPSLLSLPPYPPIPAAPTIIIAHTGRAACGQGCLRDCVESSGKETYISNLTHATILLTLLTLQAY
jgi:hypothetical protein